MQDILRRAWITAMRWGLMLYTRLIVLLSGREYIAAYTAAFGLLLLGLIVLYFQRPFTSDDVVIQTIFHQHLALSGGQQAWLGEDNYIIKVPYYLLMDVLINNSRLVLFTSTALFNLAGLALFLYSCRYFMRRFKIDRGEGDGWGKVGSLLPIVWLLSLSSTLGYWFLYNPNQRNVEIGACFLALVGFAKYTDGELRFEGRKGEVLAGGCAFLLGLFLYSDPYFMAMLLGPVLLLALAGYIADKSRRSLRLLWFLAAGFVVTLALRLVAAGFDIHNRHVELHFIPFSAFWQNVNLALEGIMSVFGTDFWGKSVLSAGVVRSFLNLLVVALVVLTVYSLLRHRQWKTQDRWLTFWVLQPPLILLIFIFSSNTSLNGYFSIRFLALLPFYVPVLLGIAYTRLLSKPHWKQRFTILLVAATILNSAFMVSQLLHRPAVQPNTENSNIVALLKHKGLQKGVAQYWNSHIHTYLSNYSITVIPVNCLQIQHFLMDDRTLALPTQRTFYLYDTKYPQQCGENELFEHIGQPTETIIVDSTKKLFIFNYDITRKLTSGYFYTP